MQRLLAPWYVHPADNPQAWRNLLSGGLAIQHAVVNIHNGPGDRPRDPYYHPLLCDTEWTTANPTGYIPVSCGRRSVRNIVRDVEHWQTWYGISSFMFDEVPSDGGGALNDAVSAVRDITDGVLIGNVGTSTTIAVASLFDIIGVDERAWADYRTGPPFSPFGADTFNPDAHNTVCETWHMVHSCPLDQLDTALQQTHRRKADYVWVTHGVLPNPWGSIPPL